MDPAKRILITGGLGFIGLNLAVALRRRSLQVRVLSRSWPPDAPHLGHMLEGVEFLKGDIRDAAMVAAAVRGSDVVFHLAGASGPSASNHSPFEHQDVNGRGFLVVLEACRELAPQARVVYPSSRLVYGPARSLPVTETAETAPLSLYGVQKLAAEHTLQVYHRLYDIPATILRITNPYGPFQQREQSRYGVINWFIHRAMRGESIPIYGSGDQVRDYLHVDDLVDAFLVAGFDGSAEANVYNVGSGTGTSLVEVAELIVRLAGRGRVEHLAWPADEQRVETGDFVADIGLIERRLGWRPRVDLAGGLREIIDHYSGFFPNPS